jgi:ketosteroid isomerase-like protein
VIFVEGSAYRLSGKANLLRGIAALIENTDLRSYQMPEPQVVLLGDTALLTYYFTESGAAGSKEFSSAGKTSMIFVKREGAWRALHEHRSVNR